MFHLSWIQLQWTLYYVDSCGLHKIFHPYNDFIMSAKVSQITSLMIVYSSIYSGEDQRKYQSSASLAFVWGIHRRPVNSPHKGPVTRKMFPFDNVIMIKCDVMAWDCKSCNWSCDMHGQVKIHSVLMQHFHIEFLVWYGYYSLKYWFIKCCVMSACDIIGCDCTS